MSVSGWDERDELLAMLAHELRNPLAAITAAYPILERRPPMDDVERRAREVILRQTQRLTRMVDGLLDVRRVTHGAITLRRERVCLNELLERVVWTVRDTCLAERAQSVELLLPEARVAVEGDATRLEQVFGNLLDNASKYMGGGVIQLELALPDDHGMARVCVRDRGVGIAAEHLATIFDLFAQSGPGIARTHGGLGIGLTLVRTLVDLHGGSVVARSEGRGKGSEFEVLLPAFLGQGQARPVERRVVAPEVVRASDHPRPAGPRRVLLIEDNSDAQLALKDLLETWGHDVITASDGVAGVERALAALPDVAVVDIGLPLLDGYEVARRIRASREAGHTYLVALTGYGTDDQKARALAAGFDVHLVKPIEPLALARLLAQVPARDHPALRAAG